ncbi:MAG: DEAD/DEAH box helicase [Candidatus Krumholzibacteriia bacterium]
MKFSTFAFDPRIDAGIVAAGYAQPTPIQEAAIPHVQSGRDVLGIAQTGTGKTAAFMLPILDRLLAGPRGRPRALVLAPTRELAEQIHQATRELGRRTKLRSVTVYGGVGKGPQIDRLRGGAEIIVACPGRLLDLYEEGLVDLSGIETLVLDEADHMFDMGFLPDVRRILAALPSRRQNLFFSATMPPAIRGLADQILNDPVPVTIGRQIPVATVSQAFYPVSEELKGGMLQNILGRNMGRRTLVFTRTKHRARHLALVLARQGHRAIALQGNMTQAKRQSAIDGFRKGRYDVLVATDIASRGIDVTGIELVVNYDMPDTLDAYTHRVGRTGRALRTGEAVNLAALTDSLLVRQIQDQIGSPIEQQVVPDFDYGGFNPRLFIAINQPRPKLAPRHGHRRPVTRGGGRRRF